MLFYILVCPPQFLSPFGSGGRRVSGGGSGRRVKRQVAAMQRHRSSQSHRVESGFSFLLSPLSSLLSLFHQHFRSRHQPHTALGCAHKGDKHARIRLASLQEELLSIHILAKRFLDSACQDNLAELSLLQFAMKQLETVVIAGTLLPTQLPFPEFLLPRSSFLVSQFFIHPMTGHDIGANEQKRTIGRNNERCHHKALAPVKLRRRSQLACCSVTLLHPHKLVGIGHPITSKRHAPSSFLIPHSSSSYQSHSSSPERWKSALPPRFLFRYATGAACGLCATDGHRPSPCSLPLRLSHDCRSR